MNLPNTDQIVIDTSPLISLMAALGELNVLTTLYQPVLVPWEVGQELQKGGARGLAVAELEPATFFKKWPAPLEIPPFLTNTLDLGEAAVIQLALTEKIATVGIDEASGRRVARLHGLSLTGTVGILIRAKREGYPFAMPQAIAQMRKPGIWLSERVIRIALEQGH